MPGFNAKSSIVGLVLLGAGFAGGCNPIATKNPATKPDTTLAKQGFQSSATAYATGPGACMHFDGSVWLCPGIKNLTIAGDRLFVRGDSITIDPITIRYRDSTFVLPVPAHADAIFFTPEAAQILLEHYEATDTAKAADLRKLLKTLPRP
jgi:hypothetical protein